MGLGSRALVYLPDYIQNGRHRRYQGQRRLPEGYAPQGVPRKTGRVFNVSKQAVGVIVNKRVRGKILPKRIYVRVEHVKHSQCRQEFLDRVVSNDERKKAANAEGKRVVLKRQPRQPRAAHTVQAKDTVPQLITPIPYEFIC